jgi:hypothetical protein
MEQPRSAATGRYVKKVGGSAPQNPGVAKDWVAKVLAHWNATRATNPAYTYKQALIAMRGT